MLRNKTLHLLFIIMLLAAITVTIRRGELWGTQNVAEAFQSKPTASPKDVVRAYWEAALAGDMQRAKTYTTNILRSVKNKDDIGADWTKIINQKRIVIKKVGTATEEGSEARVVVDAVDSDKEWRTLQHDLVREKGGWKILAIYYATDLPDDIVPR